MRLYYLPLVPLVSALLFCPTTSGESVAGRLVNQDIFTVQMLDATGKLCSFNKSDLRTHGFTGSPMGPLDEDNWTDQDVADLVACLASPKSPRHHSCCGSLHLAGRLMRGR